MTDQLQRISSIKKERIQSGLAGRLGRESRFKAYGITSISLAFSFLFVLIFSIVSEGYTAFYTTEIKLEVTLSPERLRIEDGDLSEEALFSASYRNVLRDAIKAALPDVESRRERRELYRFISNGAEYDLRDRVLADSSLVGQTITYYALAGDNVNQFNKGNIDARLPEDERQFKNKDIEWFSELKAQGRINTTFNTNFFTNGDSRDPELAGIWGATVGSFFTLLITLALSFPIGVSAAIYLEEFAPKNRVTELIEVNINNLAAVPSIVFGLLGLAIFLNFADLPRSAPLVGGLVLTLMTLPTIIISSRAAIKAVPPSIRDAALGVGASKMQMVMHHVLPLAMPGMLTGTIIGMAQALGETAPLLMIGMVAFIVDIPSGPMDAATALPVQIYLWAENPEKGFVENTSGAIMVLLAFLAFMNACAVVMRKRLERRW
ncbi:Phosphate transport system permease ABC transporter protein [Vibrio nigripulchritudo MADA3029]|uniref:phosphate ABC transporter permease PstA n=1 Tax=Vibrio nigripulchritudo TaxID=28173 RepID=UPI0003B1997B|nr:phosphate ABC transporter permease PstA [Vibrio nigripulchritudo]CCN50011.1 Phosphate transport system permease ABC transporter protein [Vibrio nigripulchritudo MADA3020]CCN56151.1 Phosphate transport system permease ABC transporter protein [Vibrio nigripulchritudo MADA3021]CCN59015.1 Phosphate transport system permease ABC transporter protein [Vibrio nigripulchritudo MADA3029]